MLAAATVNDWLQLPAGLIIFATFGAAVIALSRLRGLKETIAILNMANEGLRQANQEQATRMVHDREALQAQMHAQDMECQKAIGNLKAELGEMRGAVQFLQSSYVTDMMATTKTGVADIIKAAGEAFTPTVVAAPTSGPTTGEVPVVSAGE